MSAIIDVDGAFLRGKIKNIKEMYLEVREGFGEWYPGSMVLKMNVLLYVTKQAMYCVFKAFAKHIKNMASNNQRLNHAYVLLGK
jgi:hypothetical protein